MEVICRLLGMELTEERRRVLASLNAAEFTALLARLDARQSWT
jgi:hypothetical protein